MVFGMNTEKKRNTGLIIGIAVAAVVAVVAAVAVFFAGRAFGSKPELRLQAAVAKMAAEMAQYGSSLSGKIDYQALNEAWETGAIHLNTDVSVTITDGETTNAEFSVDALFNESQKKGTYDIGVGMYGFQIPFANVAATSDTLYISLPQFLKDTYHVELTNLGEKFNSSEWAELLDTTLPEDYSVELFQKRKADNVGTTENFISVITKSDAVIKENTTFENIKNKETGRAGVRVTVAKDAVNQYMEALKADIFASDFYETYMDGLMERAGDASEAARLKKMCDEFIEQSTAMRFKTDYVLDYYFDEKGRIVNISSPADMETEDGALAAVDIRFSGEARALDVIEGGIYIKNGGKITHLGMERNASVSESAYKEDIKVLWQTDDHGRDMTFSYVNDFNKEDLSYDMELMADVPDGKLFFAADGEFTDIAEGGAYTLRVNNASLAVDDEELCYLSAVVELEPTEEEPEIPGESVDLLGMSMQDIQKMVYEALASVRKFDYE